MRVSLHEVLHEKKFKGHANAIFAEVGQNELVWHLPTNHDTGSFVVRLSAIIILITFVLFVPLMAGDSYSIRKIPPNSTKFQSIYSSCRATQIAKGFSKFEGVTKRIKIIQHVKGRLYLAEYTRGGTQSEMPIKLIAVKLNPSENLHTDGERITIKFNRATSTYQYINTQGAKTTVELWTELAPTNTSFMSKAEFYAAIKSGETFDIIVPKTKMGTGQRVITVEW